MRNKPTKELLDAMWQNPDNWNGPFYVNPKDPRIHVPKKFPKMGWTLNFGNNYIFIGLSLIIIIIAASALFL